MPPVRALWFARGRLHLVDQRQLPGTYRVLALGRVAAVAEAIRNMTVRGAPAIGVAAAYGMALAAREPRGTPEGAAALLRATRPTAHDLFVGVETVRAAWARGDDPLAAADAYREAVVSECHAIGIAGAPLLREGARVLTHCNAGALATAGYGTALGVIRAAVESGKTIDVFADETRPFLQGARLTAWELQQDGIATTLITDNMAGHFLKSGRIGCVVVGADRIAANGDVANKVGTYSVAVLAKENGVPFFVAAPISTLDLTLASGDAIPIEQRPAAEVTHMGGRALAPEGIAVENPAFDVTPARYVSAIITEKGVARAPYEVSLKDLVNGN